MIENIVIVLMIAAKIDSVKILDKDVRTCKLSDPNLDLCVKTLLGGFKNTLRHGDYKHEVAPLEPLLIGNMSLSLKKHHVDLVLDLVNIKLNQFSKFDIEGVTIDDSKRNYTLSLSLPSLVLVGHIQASGALYDYKGIFGSGTFNINSENDTALITLKGITIKYKGIRHLQVSEMITKLNIDNFFLTLDMDWGSLLSATTAKMFNSQQDVFIELATPLIEKRVSEVLRPVINHLIGPYPLDLIFPK